MSKLGHASQYRHPALRARPLLGLAVALGVFALAFLLRYAFGGELYNVPFITAGERLFESAQGRLDTMARIHRRLYSPDTVDLPVHEFFQGLCQDMLAARSVQNVKRLVKASHVTFDLERLIPLGLLLNELVTNSAKHAFSENAGGTISVTLEQQDEKLLALTVKDDGHGLPQGIDVANGRSFGLRIMNGLAVQLGGSFPGSNRSVAHPSALCSPVGSSIASNLNKPARSAQRETDTQLSSLLSSARKGLAG